MQVMEGDLARTIEANLGRIAHIQIADNPGRNEPGTGEINYPYLYEHIDRIGYAGWVGAEYKPKAGHGRGAGLVPGVCRQGERGGVGAVRSAPSSVLPDISPAGGEAGGDARRSPRLEGERSAATAEAA